MGINEFVNLIGNAGIMVALVVFFVWKMSKEKEELNQRINHLEDYIKGKLTEMVLDTTLALNNSAQQTEENTKALKELSSNLHGFHCSESKQ